MCFGAKTPAPPKVQAAPTVDDTAAATADTRRRVREQQSTYGSIFTSVLGDPNYGSNAGRVSAAPPSSNAVAVIGA
jgi:hypothetical protein